MAQKNKNNSRTGGGASQSGNGRKQTQSKKRAYDDGFQYSAPSGSSGNRNSANTRRSFQDIDSFSSKQAYENRNKGSQKANNKSKSKNGYDDRYDDRKYKKVKGKKRHPVRKTILIILAIVAALLIVFGVFLHSKLNTKSIKRDKNSLGISSMATNDPLIKNIALFGVDAREDSYEGRSDSIMVLSVDSRHGKLKLTSLLRDSYVDIDGYNPDKLNHAYAFGGPPLAIKTINQNFNLNIEDYVTVNFTGMSKIVDAFGGVNIYVTDEEVYEINHNLDLYQYDDPDSIVLDADYLSYGGDLHLNGNQAVAYARIRNVGGDEGRAQRQRTVLAALATGISDLGMENYMQLFNEVLPLCETSLTATRIAPMAPIVFRNIKLESISVPSDNVEYPEGGYTDAGGWVFIYDLSVASHHIDAFIYEERSSYWNEYSDVVIAERDNI